MCIKVSCRYIYTRSNDSKLMSETDCQQYIGFNRKLVCSIHNMNINYSELVNNALFCYNFLWLAWHPTHIGCTPCWNNPVSQIFRPTGYSPYSFLPIKCIHQYNCQFMCRQSHSPAHWRLLKIFFTAQVEKHNSAFNCIVFVLKQWPALRLRAQPLLE